VNQPTEGLQVLRNRAKELDLDLIEVSSTSLSQISLGTVYLLVVDNSDI
jgi:hypothetical protein